MFAIKIAQENRDKILVEIGGDEGWYLYDLDMFAGRPYPFYLVSGYINNFGEFLGWVILPESAIKTHFDFNPDAILTGWDQIVRKEDT